MNETNIYYEDIILKAIDKDLTSINFNTSDLDNGIDDVFIYNNKTKFTLTTSNNQKNNYYTNTSSIDLGQCELLLREYYNISENENLYIRKIEVAQDDMKIPKIEYEIFARLNNSNLEKLNKSICSNTDITISLPIILNEEDIDKLNSSSGYFNDICYTTTSENGTDIPLNDR